MGRKYTVPLTGAALTAAGEILAITMPANKFGKITRHVIKIVNNALPTAQMMQFEGTVFTTATGGTGGTAVTPQKTQQGDQASDATALRQNTVVNSGTVGSAPYRDGCYAYQGIDSPAPGDGITLLSGQIYVLTLVQAPAGAVSVSFDGYVELEQEG